MQNRGRVESSSVGCGGTGWGDNYIHSPLLPWDAPPFPSSLALQAPAPPPAPPLLSHPPASRLHAPAGAIDFFSSFFPPSFDATTWAFGAPPHLLAVLDLTARLVFCISQTLDFARQRAPIIKPTYSCHRSGRRQLARGISQDGTLWSGGALGAVQQVGTKLPGDSRGRGAIGSPGRERSRVRAQAAFMPAVTLSRCPYIPSAGWAAATTPYRDTLVPSGNLPSFNGAGWRVWAGIHSHSLHRRACCGSQVPTTMHLPGLGSRLLSRAAIYNPAARSGCRAPSRQIKDRTAPTSRPQVTTPNHLPRTVTYTHSLPS